MSDDDPRPPGARREPFRAPEVDPVKVGTAGGIYLVGGVTLVLLLVAGLLFYTTGVAPSERTEQARPADRITITPTTPAPAAPTVPTPR